MAGITFVSFDDPVVFINSCIITTPGVYRVADISIEDVRLMIKDKMTESAIGHQPIADILTTLLDHEVEMNRTSPHQRVNQIFIAVKLNTRVAEGVILNKADIDRIGYGFRLIERLA